MLRVIKELRPAWVVGENVSGIVNMALDTVFSDLEGIGYTCQTFIIPACAVDAPHRRDRCAIVANANGVRLQGERATWEQISRTRPAQGTFEGCSFVSDTDDRRGTMRRDGELPAVESLGGSWGDNRGRTPEHGIGERRSTEPRLGRGAYGFSDWMDGVRTEWADGTWETGIPRIATGIKDRVGRLKCLGNAVVPAQFYPIFKAIYMVMQGGNDDA